MSTGGCYCNKLDQYTGEPTFFCGYCTGSDKCLVGDDEDEEYQNIVSYIKDNEEDFFQNIKSATKPVKNEDKHKINNKEEEKQSVLNCKICTELYNIKDRKPVVLLCGHLFCK